jgi:MFS family permease
VEARRALAGSRTVRHGVEGGGWRAAAQHRGARTLSRGWRRRVGASIVSASPFEGCERGRSHRNRGPTRDDMQNRSHARPFVIFLLYLPYGISMGFLTVTLPYVLTHAGLSVARTASIVAIALLPNTLRFVLAPLVDLSLTLRRWWLIGLAASTASLLLLGFTHVDPAAGALITIVAVLSQIGANVLGVPVGAMMAHCIADDAKGRAAGWYQAGNLGGAALGGAGVWIASHYGAPAASMVFVALMLACTAALPFVPDRSSQEAGVRLSARLRAIGRDFRETIRAPQTRLVLLLILMPMEIGAATNLWSSIASDWHASAEIVALTTGVINGVAAIAGCLVGGWVADRVGRYWLFFGSAVLMSLVALGMAELARTPMTFAGGVLCYAFTQGLANAAFSALLLHGIGRGAAATKYAILSSIGNVPVSYMTAFDGWTHDRWGASGMLNAEALLGLAFVPIGLFALRHVLSLPPQTAIMPEVAQPA